MLSRVLATYSLGNDFKSGFILEGDSDRDSELAEWHLEDKGGLNWYRLLVAEILQQALHSVGCAECMESGVQLVKSCMAKFVIRLLF